MPALLFLAALGALAWWAYKDELAPANNGGSPGAFTPDTSASPMIGGTAGALAAGSGDAADIMARTMIGEADEDGAAGMTAVGNVIYNRFKAGSYGDSIASVCLAPNQFDCWNIGDPNRSRIENISTGSAIYQQAYAIAQNILSGAAADNTGGAIAYRNPSDSISSTAMAYFQKLTPTVMVGRQQFYASGQGG